MQPPHYPHIQRRERKRDPDSANVINITVPELNVMLKTITLT